MSYQVLARKWRPRNFSTLVGQEHVVKALTHALNEKRLHHAYLFTGTRGVGKTTIARILAKSLNCETGVSATPCGHCSACQEIDGGRFVDLLEVDAATNTRVEEMRQLLENAIYAPTRGRYKVYVIDEVHMLSTSAFNAMLKTLEEPPEHVKFILATTDPQKIPVTVLSRCLQFNLKQMPIPAIVEHLTRILGAEEIPFEPDALMALARSAGGSMRDALSLLDQGIAHGAGRLDAAQVRDMLGTVDVSYLWDILDALVAKDGASMLEKAREMEARSLSFANALQELALLLTQLQLAQLAGGSLGGGVDEQRLKPLLGALSPEFVQLAYQIVTLGRQELVSAPDEFSGFAMVLMRLLAFYPLSDGAVSPVSRQAQVPVSASRAPVISAPASKVVDSKPTVQPPTEGEGVWHEVVNGLNLTGMARELAHHCNLVSRENGRCVLRLAPEHKHLLFKPALDKLQQALNAYWKEPLVLQIEQAEVEQMTPAQAVQQQQQARHDQAVAAIESDAFVRDAIETFDASLVDASIKPLN